MDLYVKTERKMEELQLTYNLTWIEVQFAKKAVDEVVKCRNTLQWSYAMAYYLVRIDISHIEFIVHLILAHRKKVSYFCCSRPHLTYVYLGNQKELFEDNQR